MGPCETLLGPATGRASRGHDLMTYPQSLFPKWVFPLKSWILCLLFHTGSLGLLNQRNLERAFNSELSMPDQHYSFWTWAQLFPQALNPFSITHCLLYHSLSLLLTLSVSISTFFPVFKNTQVSPTIRNPKHAPWDFPGDPVAKTLYSQCRGLRFGPWSGN